jgi:hypothetical protein
MNINIKIFFILINILGCHTFNNPIFPIHNKGSKITILNYNNVYSSFYKWSSENKESQPKIIEDTLWLSKYRFVNPNVIVGVYNDCYNLNYICLLRKLSSNNYKLLNIFANPSNNYDDDLQLFKNIFEFTIMNGIKLNTEKLNEIDKSRYLLTYIYYYSQINAKNKELH